MKNVTDQNGDEYLSFGAFDVVVAVALVALAYFLAGYFG